LDLGRKVPAEIAEGAEKTAISAMSAISAGNLFAAGDHSAFISA